MASTDLEVQAKEQREERELGTLPIGRLFVKYSAISLVGMIAQILMVVVEGIIMGYGLGAHGLACVSLIISVELVNLAVGGALGTGTSAAVGARLGSGDDEGAQRAFGQGFWLTVISAVTLTVVLEIFMPQVVRGLGATDDIYADTLAGIRVFVGMFPLTIIGQVVCAVLRVDERPRAAAALQVISSVVAISYLALAILVMGWGVPHAGLYYGLTIAIWALGVFYFIPGFDFLPGGRSQLTIRLADLHFEASIIKEILKIGFPYFMLQIASAIYSAVVNNRLGALGTSMDIAAFAIINGYVIYVLMLVVLAFTYAMQAISSFNYGAKRYDRLAELVSKGLVIQTIVMAVISVIVCMFPEAVCSVFASGDTELIQASAQPVRIVVALSALGYMGQLMSGYFECIERVGLAALCGCALYIVFTVPLLYIMGATMGIEGVWMAQLVANVLTGILVIVLSVMEVKRLRRLQAEAA